MGEAPSSHLPEGALVVTNFDGDVWQLEYPRLDDEAYDEFHEAIELWEMGEFRLAEKRYRKLIEAFPEFIDAYHHLALALSDQGKLEEAFRVWQEVVQLGLSCLPAGFERGVHQLPWMILENRPFLRAYHGLGLEYLARGWVEEALGIFNEILTMNPDDNQGVRSLVVDCNLRLKRPEDVIAVSKRYPGDAMEGVVYGCVLALYQLGELAKAEKALRSAIEMYPLIAEELLKTDHPQPEGLRADRVTLGGADQAYYYWVEQGGYWEETPGALDLVRRCRPGAAQ
jgi:tetratricopeptide (TPR) repeat protein